ncbi:MAG: hypothetical protein ACJ789_12785 [Thermomicrobiales bacterium]
MRRILVLAILLAVVLGGLLIFGRAATIGAQDSTPAAMAGHPLVGTWLLDTDTGDPNNSPTLATFTADGIYTQLDADGSVGIGSWQTTGDTSAAMTFHGFNTEDGQYSGMFTVRAAIEVAADGHSLTATYTLEFVSADGTATGQYGPGNVTGTKVAVEAMGTPQGPIEDLFAQFGGGTPEATPGP